MSDMNPDGPISAMLKEIDGVYAFPTNTVSDERGSLSSFLLKGNRGVQAAQINVVRSEHNVLRGLHAHSKYDEYYIPVLGRMYFVLVDARKRSSTFRRKVELTCDPKENIGFRVPIGVVHGVYFAADALLVYGISAAWSGDGELECRWNDPELNIEWPCASPTLSERDSRAGSFRQLVDRLNQEIFPI
jgi:dTDP-4-dehydrorhamnose 3,5-epimerase